MFEKLYKPIFSRLILLLVRVFYRVRRGGETGFSSARGRLIIINHVSIIDFLFVAACCREPVYFAASESIRDHFLSRLLSRFFLFVPGVLGEEEISESAAGEIRSLLKQNRTVCVFAEGSITAMGSLRRFNPDIIELLDGTCSVIVPANIGGIWGSMFSHRRGSPGIKMPRGLRRKVSVFFGPELPADAPLSLIRQKVMELSCLYWDEKKQCRRPLGEMFVRSARHRRRSFAMVDTTGKELNWGRVLTASILLGDKIESMTKEQDKIAIFMPTSIGGALANLAVSLQGKVPVNLNYTASYHARQVAIEECGIKTILTSKLFIRKLGDNFQPHDGMVFLEDIMASISVVDKLKALLKSYFKPARSFGGWGSDFSGDATAAVIYSSGSSGTAKGVMLSHHNVISNIESFTSVFNIYPADKLLGMLPFFHSFGFTCLVWLPAIKAAPVVYVANPFDAGEVGRYTRDYKATVLITLPTFLLNYSRRIPADDFKSLRYTVGGAEKLKKTVSDVFEKKFGSRPFEGYGATELSPVATLNLPHTKETGDSQQCSKEGTIGRLIPGLAVKFTDIETGGRLGFGEAGVMHIKGPSVMKGYLNRSEETKEVLDDGWYNTGDVGKIDEDGFITLTDRLSRFSKIGGEMLPHVVIEDMLNESIGENVSSVAVTSVPDDRKGEQLVVFYERGEVMPDSLKKILNQSQIPNLWKPHSDNYFAVETIPRLGSGKVDLLKLRRMALEKVEDLRS
ncbi:Bifunctional protein aas [Limihaloglobus sulfuriphilus]|uniref:Bifunctional protein aas n=1 Tax=Limihaloglobus sulfuriphilus TaxID=1851148 RepID=A0A1Q2MC08_9BACT|nr:AMP-binding protein [Limihaloglobus sulfuriphilus]AQQ70204.1 Bifunctional protein aas [Limihaloglobus sulfuriphilus]